MPWRPWPVWAPPQSRGVIGQISPRDAGNTSGNRAAASVAHEDSSPRVSVDALGMARILRTESLTAICLLIIAACALGFMMFFLRAILIPFAIAVFLMYLLQPMVNYICKPPRRWCDKCVKRRGEVCCEGCFRVTKSRTYSSMTVEERSMLYVEHTHAAPKGWDCYNKPLIPRWIAVILAISLLLTALAAIGAILYGSILNLQANFGKYEDGADQLASVIDRWLKKYHYSLDEDFMPYILEKVRDQVPRALKLMISLLQYFFLVAIFLVYLLISPVRPIRSSVWGIIDLHIRRYIRLKTMVGILVATVVAIMLWLLGVQMAYVFGIITFVLNFIPNLGPLIATFLPMPLVIFDPDLPHLYQVFAFLGPTVAHLVIGNFVEPGLFGESFELSPVVVLLSLAFWGSLWGIPGMILAVPMIVIVRIVCGNLDHPYAEALVHLLAGKIFEPRSEEDPMANWGNRAGIPWGNERADEALAEAEKGEPETGAARHGFARRGSTSTVAATVDEDLRRYGATSGS